MEKELYEEKLESKKIFEGKILNLYYDKVMLPNKKISTREMVTHPGAVAVVPVNKDNELLLVKQYRYPIKKVIIEIPAGKLDKGEDPVICAKRELHEEVGVIDGKIIHLATIYTSPGFSNELMEIYMAVGFRETDNSPDHDEFLNIFKIKLKEGLKMIGAGRINDAKSIIGILLARDYIKNEDYIKK